MRFGYVTPQGSKRILEPSETKEPPIVRYSIRYATQGSEGALVGVVVRMRSHGGSTSSFPPGANTSCCRRERQGRAKLDGERVQKREADGEEPVVPDGL